MAETILTLAQVATPPALFEAEVDGRPEVPDWRPSGLPVSYRQCVECIPPTNVGGLSRAVMGLTPSVPRMAECNSLLCRIPLRLLVLGKRPENILHHAERVERATLSARFRKRPRYSFGACFRIRASIFVAFDGSAYGF